MQSVSPDAQIEELQRVCAELAAQLAQAEERNKKLEEELSARERTPPCPPGMVELQAVTPAMRQRQRRQPHMWTVTMRQWCDILKHCKQLPQYQHLKRSKGFVNMYDMNQAHPHTLPPPHISCHSSRVSSSSSRGQRAPVAAWRS